MDTMLAFANAQAAQGEPIKVFDWDEAARRIVKSGMKNASAGLGEDWEWTGGDIFMDGKPLTAEDSYTYLASNWATPELVIDDGVSEACFRLQSETDGWDATTSWPESSLAILRGESA